MQYLDTTILNTAIPTIARDLHTPAINLNIIVISYLLAQTIIIPSSSAIAERIGPKFAFVLALAVFLCGSVLCAASTSLVMLTAMRAVQGLGGGMMIPLSRLILVRTTDKSELISAMNWVAIPGALGPLIGPAAGGLLVTHGSWQLIFLINVPIALAGIALMLVLVPKIPREAPAPFDLPGLAMISLMVVGAVLALELVSSSGSGWIGLSLIAASGLLLVLYLRHSRNVAAPAIDLSLFRIATFRRSMLAGSAVRIVVGGIGFVLPLWFQLAMHMRADTAGSIIMMISVGTLLSRPVGALLLRHFHPRDMALYGLLALSIALAATSQLGAGLPRPIFYAMATALGVAVAVPMLIITPMAYLDLPPQRIGAANAFYVSVQQIALSLGVTTAVWSMSGLGLVTASGPAAATPYVGTLLIFAGFALLAAIDSCKLDRTATGALRAERG